MSPANSGTAAAPITFAAYAHDSVVVDGADPITGWTLSSGSIYSAPATLAAAYGSTISPANTDLAANQVFVGGAMMPEEQWPEPGASAIYPQRSVLSSITSGSGTPTGTLADTALPALGSLVGDTIAFTGAWNMLSGTVTANSAGSLSYTMLASDGWIYPGLRGQNKYRVLGSLNLLTVPGEWFYDSAASRLYLWALGGGVPIGVEAKTRNYAFDLRGRSYISISGNGITAATVITDAASTDVHLDAITATYLSHFVTHSYVAGAPYGNIYSSRRDDTGIVLDGAGSGIRNSTIGVSADSGIVLGASNATAANNLVTDTDYGATYASALTLTGGTTGQLVQANTIVRTGRDGININSVAGGTYGGNRITGNDVSAYGVLLADLGGIYTRCSINWSGSRIDHNVVSSSRRRRPPSGQASRFPA